MSLLDDPDHRAAVDPDDALAAVEGSAAQWRAAAALAGHRVDLRGVDGVVVAGMGGSGIVGDVVAAMAASRLAVPVAVQKGYELPAWVGPRSLVAAVSYSGDTEETLAVAQAALTRGATLIAVASGGALAALASDGGFPVVVVPGGGQPRHSLGWLVVPLLVALRLDDGLDEAFAVLERVGLSQGRDVCAADNPAKRLGSLLASGTLPVAYGGNRLAALAALRLRCQLNENAKMPAVDGHVPELCHNEVVGWDGVQILPRGVIWLRDRESEHARERQRVELVAGLLASRARWQATITAMGEGQLARLASLILQADLASVYAAHARGVDPSPVALITELKSALGKVST